MSKDLNIQLIAHTDAAGKFKPSAPLGGNEDNFYVSIPLTHDLSSDPQGCAMPQYGLIMAVADGMGGLSHGEMASRIAVDTVGDCLSSDKLSAINIESSVRRRMLLEETIKTADINLKARSEKLHLSGKMGSTLIIAWLYADELVVSWIGDSRAYIFSPKNGISPVSHDHSLVQMLVDRGEISYDEAFDHPKNNIVSRCLGDPTQDANPSSCIRKVAPGDLILMCSDGLTGVLRDRKSFDRYGSPYPEENIEDILRQSVTLNNCQQGLWTAARRGGWHDNVTTILCRILEARHTPVKERQKAILLTNNNDKKSSAKPNDKATSWISYLMIISIVVLLAACIFVLIPSNNNMQTSIPETEISLTSDTLQPPEGDFIDDDVPLADREVETDDSEP